MVAEDALIRNIAVCCVAPGPEVVLGLEEEEGEETVEEKKSSFSGFKVKSREGGVGVSHPKRKKTGAGIGRSFATVRSSLPGGWCNREQNDGAEENSAHLNLQVKKNEMKKKIPCAILHSVKFLIFMFGLKLRP